MGIALVTGGSSGIGAEFARQLAGRGHDIVLVARDQKRLDAMAAELRATGREVEVIVADLASRADTNRVAARLADPAKPVDILVNNAGFRATSRLTSLDIDEHDRAFAVMQSAPLILSNAIAPHLRAQNAGAIINVASINGQLSLSNYSAIKAWVTVFTESLANEFHGTGVTVTALLPGWVRTEFHQRAGSGRGGIPNFLWADPEPLVRETLRDVDRGRVISIPSLRYKLLSGLVRHLPRSTVRAVSRRISLSRSKAASE
ncbi:SDR family NAD(P)-dependent oxidoreductase [soil metagenome]